MEKVAQLSWESTCLTSRGSLVRAQQRPPFNLWGRSSVGQSAGLSRQRSRVRVPSLPPYYAQIAQSVEQGTENPCVRGSIPRLGTTYLKNKLGDVVEGLRRRSAKPFTPVRIRSSPPSILIIAQKLFFLFYGEI